MRQFSRICLALALLVSSAELWAHARSESYSNWEISGNQAVAVVTVSTGEIMTVMDPTQPESVNNLLSRILAETISVRSMNTPCIPSEPLPLAAPRGFERMEVRFNCGQAEPRQFTYRALFDALPAHVHYARIFADGLLIGEQLVTDRADTWQRSDGPIGHSFSAFLDLGIRHILAGVDHIAFLLGMLLIAGTFGRSVAAVTGFTLGHSLSLGAAVLGYVSANGRLVEAFIGFTVALVALEYFAQRRPGNRSLAAVALIAAWGTGAAALAFGAIGAQSLAAYLGFGVFAFCYLLAAKRLEDHSEQAATSALFAVTTAFGLVHGFGFAGFLMETGLGGGSLFAPLLGFNLGVEAGQLLLLAVAFLAAKVLRNVNLQRLAPPAAAALCGVGVFWFVGRSLAA